MPNLPFVVLPDDVSYVGAADLAAVGRQHVDDVVAALVARDEVYLDQER